MDLDLADSVCTIARLSGCSEADARSKRKIRRREPLNPTFPAGRPREHVALYVADGNDGVVERGLDVRHACALFLRSRRRGLRHGWA